MSKTMKKLSRSKEIPTYYDLNFNYLLSELREEYKNRPKEYVLLMEDCLRILK